ncbi:hypothetical protein DL766_008710 [Monosporascus sp. MC13-8B]|uniref:Exo-1,4-beta-D-glucosaminidase n=1 Tax=Monosporascus cannonballus TaxID=155416 RepID=A0ABY0GW58_9PEZI|nr:hypothetical protein DL762_009564 [Monosporascus cannonballus]RYP18273.1 hypothetical protein DL766_008710 [Monosporascus sp. MC13-8B]
MRLQKLLAFGAGVETATAAAAANSLSFTSARTLTISSWKIRSTAEVGNDLAALSQTDVDTASWQHVESSRCTLMGCLLQAGVYADSDLFYSDNLKHFDASIFQVPWLYRHDFKLNTVPGRHYFLQTHGITSKADIFLNGHEIANSTYQAGSYVGRTYDITKLAKKENALVIQVYPTDYNYDFALGFVDWNPYPPDNGTGVWRNVEIKETGPVVLGPLRVRTETTLPIQKSKAWVSLRATARNLEDHEITIDAIGHVSAERGGKNQYWKRSFTLGPRETIDLDLSTTLQSPKIWWPKAWGDQPLYKGRLSVSVRGSQSDVAESTFGIRKVTSQVSQDDRMFYVNGYPFQVIGGGYSADMFLRWDGKKFARQAELMLELGHNTVRLEGKNEHPELYDIADRMGLMVMAGWECCDKWEAWSYNEDLAVKDEWTENDYVIAKGSMLHEALMQQTHPSMLTFLVGSDYWPDDKATKMYMEAFEDADWQMPILSSASKRGYPELLGPSGLKMAGPYDYVPPNYWYDVEPAEDRLGAAFGFGSELGAGVGTPEMGSLKKFLSESDLEDLWKRPNKGLYHMSTEVSAFYTREIYNDALWKRYGAPTSLDDYLMKAQIMDYEATRAQFEGFSIKWSAERPATGLIYWMLNNAWPSLHWNLFDYYLHPAGSYFGAKLGSRLEHVAYDYVKKDVHLINHSIDRKGLRMVIAEAVDMNGRVLFRHREVAQAKPNSSKSVRNLSKELSKVDGVAFLRLALWNGPKRLSRNVYWLTKTADTLNWEDSTWYYTPVESFVNFTSLNDMKPAKISVRKSLLGGLFNKGESVLVLQNHSPVPAFFVRLNLVDKHGKDVVPVFWSDNYVTLWPHEKLELRVRGTGGHAVEISGMNVAAAKLTI